MNASTFALLASAALLTACAASGPSPYAVVTGERPTVSDPTVESVLIVGVNGRLEMRGLSEVRVEPGPVWLSVRTTRRDGRPKRVREASVVLNAKPCMRYFVIARHESQFAEEPWSAQVSQQEPIRECLDQFPGGLPLTPAGAPASTPAASSP